MIERPKKSRLDIREENSYANGLNVARNLNMRELRRIKKPLCFFIFQQMDAVVCGGGLEQFFFFSSSHFPYTFIPAQRVPDLVKSAVAIMEVELS